MFVIILGISVPECNEKAQLLCFDSCYDGEFKSPQYVNLPTHGQAIQHHTLPTFVPLNAILENHNKFNSRHKSLVASISDYLSAFIKRREDALKVKVGLVSYFKPLNFFLEYFFCAYVCMCNELQANNFDISRQTYKFCHPTIDSWFAEQLPK